MNRVVLISVFFSLSCFAIPSQAADFGFDQGNEYQNLNLRSRIYVRCADHRGRRGIGFRCEKDNVDPSNTARFFYKNVIDADKVTLVATHLTGSKQKKKRRYSSKKGESWPVNLVTGNIFNRPLLKVGANEVKFTLTKDGEVVDSGSFNVYVKNALRRSCRSRSYYSNDSRKCSPAAQIYWCQQYFRVRTNCL